MTSPNNPTGYDHHGFWQGVEEVLQRPTLLTHLSQGDTQNNAKAYQTQNITAGLVLALDFVCFQVA